jgi:flagellar basal-body rod protein FlgC
MSSPDIFAIVGSALDAQSARMGAIASNLANVDSVTPPGGTPYRAHEVVFEAAPVNAGLAGAGDPPDLGVNVVATVQSNAPPKLSYEPGSPYADAQGYVTGSNVSQVGQMVDLIDASNSYAASVAVLQQSSRIDQQMLSSFQVT